MSHHARERSEQTKQLRRLLTGRLCITWLLYTATFIIIALILNITLVPKMANTIADGVSSWQYWDRQDLPLDTCLDKLDATLFAMKDSWDDPNLLAQEQAAIEREAQALLASGETEEDVLSKLAIARASAPLDASTATSIDPYAPLLISINDNTPEWMSLADLQVMTVRRMIDLSAASPENWQFFATQTGIEGRDLSIYNAIRALKYPIAILLYLIGCFVVIFRGYGRALRYFDELAGAVASMLEHRDEPIKLPPQLHLTQDELNDLRMRSLADERAAKAAERRKDELVAYLAHDVRTPLTSVMGYLMLLDEAPDMPEEARQRYIRTAAEKSLRLEGLIDEFFEITHYNLQAIPIERENVDVRLFCQQEADESFPDAEARSIALHVDAPEGDAAFIDPEKLARALGNIMRNAVTYADADTTIQMHARIEGDTLSITVTDQGREISPAHLERVFEQFYREDGARSSAAGRSGLGLAIAKEIVTAHGGTIEAQSTDGMTTFTMRVPAHPSRSARPVAAHMVEGA